MTTSPDPTAPDPFETAATAYRADLAVDLDVEGALVRATGPRPNRNAGRVALVLAAVVAMVVGVTQFRPTDDVEVAVEEVTSTTSTTMPDAPDFAPSTPGTPLALGGARDGVDSVGLPITVSPATDLVDGQSVTVTGSGFPPGESIGVVLCTREAARDYGAQGVAACNIGIFASATADDQGVAVATFTVRRVVVLGDIEVDCAESTERCLIGMGMISDYDQSGGALIDFAPADALLPRPIATVTPTSGLRDGDEVRYETTPLTSTTIQQCVVDTGSCLYADVNAPSGTVHVWRQFAGYDETTGLARNFDCAVDACELRFTSDSYGRAGPESVPLSFDPAGPFRTSPAVTVLPDTTVPAGSSLRVSVESSSYALTLCAPDAAGQIVGDESPVCVYTDTAISRDLQVFDDASICGAAGCILTVELFDVDQGGALSGGIPPALAVDPIRIFLTDV